MNYSKILSILIYLTLSSQLINSQCYNLSINNSGGINYSWNFSITPFQANGIDASFELTGSMGNFFNGNKVDLAFGTITNTSLPASGTFTYSGPESINTLITFSEVFTSLAVEIFACSVLPITLSTFSATQYSQRSSRLNWNTASEINSEYFGIERSHDGETWETIERIAAAGNSNEALLYEYIDDLLPFTRSKDQIFYYRLRLTDLDGTYKYSDIKGVNFTRLQNEFVSIYPNPTTDRVNVDVSGIDATAGDIQLSVFDNAGHNMLQKKIIGTGIELIETINYPAGTYNIVVKQGETIHQKKVIKLD